MSRLMSVAHTERSVVDRAKTVTRRLGWLFLLPGDRLTLCRKVMGRKHADGSVDPLVRLVDVEVTSARREQLCRIFTYSDPDGEAIKEGVVDVFTAAEFVDFYCRTFKVQPHTLVNRIEWRYLDGATS